MRYSVPNWRPQSGRFRGLRIAVVCCALTFFVATTRSGTLAHPYAIRDSNWECSWSVLQERQLPDGPGMEEARKVCSGCHELEKSFSVRQDRVGWQSTIEKMVSLGAKATDHEFNAVLQYLVKNFPADESPMISVNKATAIELESGLSLKRSEAAAIIKYRTQFGRFKSIADLRRVPGIDFSKMETKKDRLLFED